MAPLCLECDESYASEGDCSGICEACRDDIEEQRRIEAMTDIEYRILRARRDNAAWRAIMKVA